METNIIHKVYSNNSKKSRLKRSKNRFARVWDAEKQKYVKVRKQHQSTRLSKAELKAIFARSEQPTKPAELPKKEQKPENKKPVRINAMPARKATTVKLYGKRLVWDAEILRYKAA